MNDTFGFIAGVLSGIATAFYFRWLIKRFGFDAFMYFLTGIALGFFTFQALILFY